MAELADAIQRGTFAARPAATDVAAGTVYFDTTNSKTWRASGTSGLGTSWEDVSDAGTSSGGSGSITASGYTQNTAKLLGRTTAGSGAIEEISAGDGVALTAGVLTGKLAQVLSTLPTAVATGSTQIPTDDTIPQNTEGDEYMSLSITPKNAGSTLIIVACAMIACSASRTMTMALFQDTTGNALAAVCNFVAIANGNTQFLLLHTMTAGTTSATTFKIRIGANSTGTVTFNGNSSARLYGAIPKSAILILEILP